jgi:diacylglycerol kinase family enzyme
MTDPAKGAAPAGQSRRPEAIYSPHCDIPRRSRTFITATMRVIVLMNSQAGTKPAERTRQAEELRAILADAGVDADVRQLHPDQLVDAARRAADDATIDAVVAAGGDGTVSTVASALAGAGKPLGVLPRGTLNHFAKDLGIPLALRDAAAVIAQQNVRPVDLGEVNERTFINNSSIGLYPHIVRERDDLRQRLGGNKWIAMLIAALRVFRRHPTVRVRIGVEDQSVLRTTPFVFIGNNRYEINGINLGRRQRLDAGELSLYFANRTGRFGLLRLAVRALFGRLEQAKDFDAMSVTELWIETPRKGLRVALDGEVTRLVPPLHYRIRTAALRVIVPSKEPDSPSPPPSLEGTIGQTSATPSRTP